ncbi:helix-turn-helix domain-containing protein [Mycolicibacter algericus]|uniref:DUF2637 domain-containing protein n=2 Tax=Mycolicibacter algericus TaxID=1288388 RepID=A0A7I9YGX1_MYCAL|nr:helix-turn-helix domain-containing protein [Mycolicibacter algericus]OQZ97072.1 hypothetical protein BST10_10820 [Mycolicibacter algericus DSM 45454]GFG87772.1 hypothetical protein MALGJ_44480 [Mycolicibacter algericus]
MTAIRLTAADLAHRHHRRAVRFFWTWLILSTCVSLVGNVAHAWILATPDTQWLATGVAVVPPTVLLLGVHGLAVLAKASTFGHTYRVALAATTALALGAFLLSFVALRDLAVIAGIRPGLAPVLPLVIDLAIGVATLALVAVGDQPARRRRNAPCSADIAAAPTARSASPNRGHQTAPPASKAAMERSGAGTRRAQGAAVGADAYARGLAAELAAELVAMKATSQPVDVVTQILAARQAGDPLNRIAKRVGVHHSTVARIINAADVHRRRTLDEAA